VPPEIVEALGGGKKPALNEPPKTSSSRTSLM